MYLPFDLERALVAATKVWLQDFLLKSPEDQGAIPVPVTVCQGYIPSFQAGSTGPSNKAPTVAIRALSGKHTRLDGSATVYFVILSWNDELSRVGYQDNLNVMSAIITGLYESGIIANSFVLLDDDVTWQIYESPTEDSFPYFASGVTAKFGIMTPGINDDDPSAEGTDFSFDPNAG